MFLSVETLEISPKCSRPFCFKNKFYYTILECYTHHSKYRLDKTILMEEVLECYLSAYDDILMKLLATKEILVDCTDEFWGVVEGQGFNIYGIICMRQRTKQNLLCDEDISDLN